MFDGWERDMQTNPEIFAQHYDNVLHILVPKQKELNFINATQRANITEFFGKQVKNVSEDDLNSMIASGASNIQQFGAVKNLHFQAHARGILSGSAGGASSFSFADVSQTLPSLRALLPDEVPATVDSDASTDKEEEDDPAAAADGKDGKDNKDKPKKVKFQKLELFCIKKEHELEKLLSDQAVPLEAELKEIKKFVEDIMYCLHKSLL